jgi:hypothetical protein
VLVKQVSWGRVALVLGAALLVSTLLPGAPVHTSLLNAHSERQRFLADNQLRLRHSHVFLHRYRRAMGLTPSYRRQTKEQKTEAHDEGQKARERREEEGEEQQQRLEDAVLFQPLYPVNKDHIEQGAQSNDHAPNNDPPLFSDQTNYHIPLNDFDSMFSEDFSEDEDDAKATKDDEWKWWRRLGEGPVDVAVTVVTMARGRRLTPKNRQTANYSTGYLTQTVATILALLQVRAGFGFPHVMCMLDYKNCS